MAMWTKQYYYVNEFGDFWSNDKGWVDIIDATAFSEKEIEANNLDMVHPIDAKMVVKIVVEKEF